MQHKSEEVKKMAGQEKRRFSVKGLTAAFCILLFMVLTEAIPSEAASKAGKARKAYREYLSSIMKSEDFKEYAGLGFGSISFAVMDISGDKIPELIVKESYTTPEGYWVYTYRKGKVKKLKSMNYYSGGDIDAVYPQKHIIKAYEGDDWDSDTLYYKVTESKMKAVARTKNGKYYVNGKKVTKTGYQSYISKIEKTKCYGANNGRLKFKKILQRTGKSI